MRVFFYPHAYLRDRQLDTIRRWPAHEVVNPEAGHRRQGNQVAKPDAVKGRIATSWKQRLPLLNLKRRPAGLDDETMVYLWGGLVASGPFIVDLDNPYALTGYNLRAMPIWRGVIKRILLSPRCLRINCMSAACRRSLQALFGAAVAAKAEVHYPRISAQIDAVKRPDGAPPRFLFIGTQFEIKGGAALLKAWPAVVRKVPGATLDMITHLPDAYATAAKGLPGLTLHEARYSRDEIWSRFMKQADVLVLPTYVESFGMVALEALAHGLALVVSDVYALPELVQEGKNGFLITPPLAIWEKDVAAAPHYRLAQLSKEIPQLTVDGFVSELSERMIEVSRLPDLESYRQNSLTIFNDKFRMEIG